MRRIFPATCRMAFYVHLIKMETLINAGIHTLSLALIGRKRDLFAVRFRLKVLALNILEKFYSIKVSEDDAHAEKKIYESFNLEQNQTNAFLRCFGF